MTYLPLRRADEACPATPFYSATTVHVSSFHKTLGGEMLGGLSQLMTIDKNFLMIDTVTVPSYGLFSAVDMDFVLPSPGSVTGLTIQTTFSGVYKKTNTSAALFVYAWNFASSQYEMVDAAYIPSNKNVTRTVRLTNGGADYFDSGGALCLLLITEYPLANAITGTKVRTRFDQVIVKADYVP